MILTFIIFTLLTLTTPLTTLSSNNCPNNFDLTKANTTGTSLSAAVDFLYSNIYSSSDQAKLQSSFYSGDTSTVNSQIS